jgi:hypothetical protein
VSKASTLEARPYLGIKRQERSYQRLNSILTERLQNVLGQVLAAISRVFAVVAVTVGLAAGSWGASSETVLHTFVNGSDGAFPFGGLTIDAKGNLYGTTDLGGTGASAEGTVFKLTPRASGGFTFQTIHTFLQGRGGQHLWNHIQWPDWWMWHRL